MGKLNKTYTELVLIGTWTVYVLIMHQEIYFYLQNPHSIIDVNAGWNMWKLPVWRNWKEIVLMVKWNAGNSKCVPTLAIGMHGFDYEPSKLIIVFPPYEYLPIKKPLLYSMVTDFLSDGSSS